MPIQVENCVQRLLKNPNFKSKVKGQSKESAAWAICTASLSKAIDNINETVEIIKQFEDYSLLDPNDYSEAEKDLSSTLYTGDPTTSDVDNVRQTSV